MRRHLRRARKVRVHQQQLRGEAKHDNVGHDMHKSILAVSAAFGFVIVTTSLAEATADCGRASWYALHSRTASGERMNPDAMTAAHRSLPFGTRLKITNQNNGKSVVVRINDRGPFIKGRVLDLSKGAARQLGFVGAGHAKVCYARL